MPSLNDKGDSARAASLRRRDVRELIRIARLIESEYLSESEGIDDHMASASDTKQNLFENEQKSADSPASAPSDAILLARATRLRLMREQRRSHFPSELLGEPAWDILLAIYVGGGGGRKPLTIARAAKLTGLSPSTTLRWLGNLLNARLIKRRPNPFDRRSALVGLSKEGLSALHFYLGELDLPGT